MRKSDKVWQLSLSGGALGMFAALMLGAPVAQADPDAPAPPPLPLPAEESVTIQAAAGDPALPAPPPAEVPHLLSPENLPPGTSDVPLDPPQGRGTSYLRDLWHAVQTQDISGKDAILLLTQRPLDANAVIDRAAVRPVPLGHGAVDHGHAFGAAVVGIREPAAADHRDTHRP